MTERKYSKRTRLAIVVIGASLTWLLVLVPLAFSGALTW